MLPIATLLAWLWAAASVPVSAPLQALLESRPADSLVAPLRKFELEHARGSEASEAAYVLGQLHFARGEYRQACDAFARAAASQDQGKQALARYWIGLSWLALKQPEQARGTLDQV